MRFRSCYIPTLKETPADAEVISQKLLIRAGMIRKLTSGVYTYMPLALRSLRKIGQGGFCRAPAAHGAAWRSVEGIRPLGALRP